MPDVFTFVMLVSPSCMVLLVVTVAFAPIAVELVIAELFISAPNPIAVLFPPVFVLKSSALKPIAVLLFELLFSKAPFPIATLELKLVP